MLFLARLWTSGILSLFILGVALSLSLAVATPARAGQDAKPSWQLEWEKTVEAAKKEGQVSIYTFGGATNLAIDAGVFQKRFPEIKVITAAGNPVPRILTERRAEKYLVDIAIGGSATPWDLYLAKALDPIKDAMILPEVVDESKWWRGKHHYIDSEKKYALMFIGTPDLGYIFYNTRLVNPKEFQSFWDFLNPKWKGKIAARDIRSPGTGGGSVRMFYHHPKLGPQFIRRFFSDTNLTLFRDRRQGVDWLVTGKFPICFFCPSSDIGAAKRQGLPVDGFGPMKEGAGVASSSGNIGLINKAPHPNAARVFLNWFLSREGQLTMQKEYSRTMVGVSNSLRVDIPKDMVPPDERLLEGIDYIEVEVAERMSIEPVRKIVNEVLAASGR